MSLFFFQHNGVVSPSPLLIVIFCCFHFFLPHGWVHPLVGIADYIGSTLLIDYIITIYHHFFLPAQWRCFTVTVVDCHIFCSFFPPLPTDECYHSLVSVITLEVLCWDIILSLYIIIVFLLSQWRRFTVTVVDCYILLFLFFSSHGWGRPFFGIADYIESTFLRDNVITIYHHCLSLSTMAQFQRHRCWLLYIFIFTLSLHTDECEYSLGLMITLEVLFWAIISLIYCYISIITLISWIVWYHSFSDFYSSTMASYHRCFYLLLFLSYLFVSVSRMIVTCWLYT